jgi:hypothetical protein
MTVNEMHIAVNLGVQKIASFQVDNLLPQEIDHELNLAMMRFIKQRFSMTSNRIGKGFEQSQKRIDDLRTLIVEHTSFTSTQGQVYTSNYSNVYVDRYTLPLDYLFLVSVRPVVQYKCNTDIIKNNLITVSTNTVSAVKVNLTPPNPGQVLVGLARAVTGGTVENILNLPVGQEVSTDELFDSGNYLFGITPSATFNQSANNTTVQQTPNIDSNHIFLNSGGWATLSISGIPTTIRSTWLVPGASMSLASYRSDNDIQTIQTKNRSLPAPTGTEMLTLASFGQHDDILYMMDDPFNKSWYHEPTYTVEGNCIDIYTDNEFVVPKVTIKYIRKPLEISINDGSTSPNTTGTGCELPVHTHHEIVEMAIKSILEGIQDPRYQTQSMETLESE